MHNHANGQAQEAIDAPHPFRIALGQIIIHRHHMHALGGQRIQVNRQGRHQRLAFAGFHLGDLAFMQHHAADHLHIEVAQAQHAAGRFPHGREGFRQQRIQGLALGQPFAEQRGLPRQRFI